MQEKSAKNLHFIGGFRNNFQDHGRLLEQLFLNSWVSESQNKFSEDGVSKDFEN
jgi:hypothetical protein